MTDPIDPELTKAIAALPPAVGVIEQTKRSQKLQEVSNLVTKAVSDMAAELKVFLPVEVGSAFDLANESWSGNVGLQHSTIPEISVKPIFSAKCIEDEISLSANDGQNVLPLFKLPAQEVNQTSVSEAVRKFLEPQLNAAIRSHSAQ
jgi:hypothetical protein